MKKILIRSPGNFNKLEYVDESLPQLGAGDAIVKTASVGVNFADCIVRMGLYPSAEEYVGWPITPGFEFSGTIESLGSSESPHEFAVGDEVFGVTRFGAYASHISVPTSQLFPVPEGVSLVQAGTVPVASLTALYALRELAAVKPGATVLVHSAAGGVGSVAVQMAKIFGCQVVGVVGAPHKAQAVKDLGADAVIDKSADDWAAASRSVFPAGFDAVLDANGKETLKKSYQLLRPTGRLIVYGAHTMLSRGSGRRNWLKIIWDFLLTPRFDPLALTNDNKSVMAFNLSYLFEEEQLLRDSMVQISQWCAAGRLRTAKLQEFPLSNAANAHVALQSGTTVGKLTLVPG